MNFTALELDDQLFGKPRELITLSVALLLHAPLLFWQGKPYNPTLGDPITEIEFKIEQVTPEPVPEPPAVVEPKKTFVERVQEKLGIATKPAPIEKMLAQAQAEKPAGLEGASGPKQIQTSAKVESILQGEKKLQDRAGGLSGAMNVASIKTSGGGLAGGGIGAAPIATQGGGTLKEKSTAFRVGAKDVPFATAKSGGGLAGMDGPRIAVGGAGDKGTRKISTQFFGSGGGTGGGDGAGHGSGGGGGKLTDKGGGAGSGLAGTGGDFGGMPSALASGGGGDGGTGTGSGLSGTGTGGGGTGSSKSPYEITGPLSGRKILNLVLPEYPAWAKEKGLAYVVSLRFYVRHSGDVRDNIQVARASGEVRLDNIAINALKQWRFEPLPESQYGKEQWGVITFKFRAL